MSRYTAASLFCAAFLGGNLLVSSTGYKEVALRVAALLLTALFAASLAFAPKVSCLMLLGVVFGGATYIHADLQYEAGVQAATKSQSPQEGIVTKVTDRFTYKRLRFETEGGGVFIVNAEAHSDIIYGDRIKVTGEVREITGDATDYFRKEGVHGAVRRPEKIERIQSGEGGYIMTTLINIRRGVQQILDTLLSPRSARFMSGLLIGKAAGFSPEFLEEMQKTGTTHLIALSGYNITVIATSVISLLTIYMQRQYALYVAGIFIIAFVLLTGAEPSVVRAAIMTGIVFLAEKSERIYAPRNVILATAVLMGIWNPHVIRFDVGFHLSFGALLGIIYIYPIIERIWHIREAPGFFSWKESLGTTLAAQLTVLPILITSFGSVALISLLTNILLLAAIPYTMTLGFFIVVAELLVPPIAVILAVIAKSVLAYEIWVITFFSQYSFSIAISSLPYMVTATYYLILIYISLTYAKAP